MPSLYPVSSNNPYITLHTLNLLSGPEGDTGVLLLKNDKAGNRYFGVGYSLRERFIIFLARLPGFSNLDCVKKALDQIIDARHAAASAFLEMVKNLYDDNAYQVLCARLSNGNQNELSDRGVKILNGDVTRLLTTASLNTEQQQKTRAIYIKIEENMRQLYPGFSFADMKNPALLRRGQKLLNETTKMLEDLRLPGHLREQLKTQIIDFISRKGLGATRSISSFQQDFQCAMRSRGEIRENSACADADPGFRLDVDKALQVNGSSLGKTSLLEREVYSLAAKLVATLSDDKKRSYLNGLQACYAKAIVDGGRLNAPGLCRDVNPGLPSVPVNMPSSQAITPLPSSAPSSVVSVQTSQSLTMKPPGVVSASMLSPPLAEKPSAPMSVLPPPLPTNLLTVESKSMSVLPPPPPPPLPTNLLTVESKSMSVLSPPPPPPPPLPTNLLTVESKSMSSIPLTMAERESQKGKPLSQIDFSAELQSQVAKKKAYTGKEFEALVESNRNNQAKNGAINTSLQSILMDSINARANAMKGKIEEDNAQISSDKEVSPASPVSDDWDGSVVKTEVEA